MSERAQDLAMRESRTARRLGRLFRIERAGRLAGRPGEIAWRLIERRARLVDELMRLDAARRPLAAPVPAELTAAIGDLAREVRRSQAECVARIEALQHELEQRRGAPRASGLRDRAAGGRLLGQV
jgi:hypothetical protein